MAADSHGGAAGLVVRREEDADAGRRSHDGVSRVEEKEQGRGRGSSRRAGRARGGVGRIHDAASATVDGSRRESRWSRAGAGRCASEGKGRPRASP
mgnify:CR=1 FL=1